MKKIYDGYNRIERVIIGLIMLVLVAMGFIQVICRFVLKVPLAWAEEMMTFCMIWVAYLGASAAANEKKHILVSMFVDLLPEKARKIMTLFSQFLWLLCSIFMIYLGYVVTANYMKRGAVTLGGHYPYWVASIVIPISMLLISIRVILLMVHTARGESDTRSQEEIVQEETEL